MNNPTIQDIMTREVISVSPEMSVFEAHEIITSNNLDGAPVIDGQNRLVGILTEYDLIVKGPSLHLPTFQKLLSSVKLYKENSNGLKSDLEKLRELKVKDVMNADPLTLLDTTPFEEVVVAFRDHHRVNPIPVINNNKRVVGVVSRFDVLKPLHLLLKL